MDKINTEKKAYQELSLFKINLEIDTAKEILTNQKKSYEVRLAALDDYFSKQQKAIVQAERFLLEEENLTQAQRLLIEEKANTELLKLNEEYIKQKKQLDTSAEETVKNQIKQRQAYLEKEQKNASAQLTEKNQAELAALAERYVNENLTLEKYQAEKQQILQQYAAEQFTIETKSLEEILALYQEGSQEYNQIQEKIAQSRANVMKQINDELIKDYENGAAQRIKVEEETAQKTKEINKQLKKALEDLYKELAKSFFSIMNSRFEKQLNEIDELSKANKEEHEEKIRLINEQQEAGILSEEQANAEREYYANLQKEREKELEEQKKEIKMRQARYEKASALTSAGIQVALAVAEALPNLVLALVVGTTGAAQIAAIAAKPLSKYAEGTSYHPGGYAIVGDGGKKELILTPDGRGYITPTTPTLVNLPRGTEVLPDVNKAMEYLSFNSLTPPANSPIVIAENKEQLQLMQNSIHLNRQTKDYTLQQLNLLHRNTRAVERQNLNSLFTNRNFH